MSNQSSSDETVPKSPKKRKRRPARAMTRRFQEEDFKRLIREFRASIPGIGVSLGVHAVLLLIMAFIVFSTTSSELNPLELGWSTKVESKYEEPTQEVIAPVQIPTVSMSNANTREEPVDPEGTQPAETVPEEKAEKPPVKLADVSRSLDLRTNTPEGENPAPRGAKAGIGREAIDEALRWIADQQQDDGHWSLSGPYPDGGSIETNTGATALALLAFLGDGNTHLQGPYRVQVSNGLNWLVRQQKSNGDLFDIEEQGKDAHFYSHSQGTIALCEALAISGDEALRGPAQKAIQFLLDSQNPELGGWKYRPLSASGIGDLSVTGWALMALHSARMADIELPFDAFLVAERFLNSVQESEANESYYKYRPDFPINKAQRHSMTAEGLLCRQWLGWPKNYPAMKRGITFLTSEANKPEWKTGRRNVYAWYYTAQTLHNFGGLQWEQWFGHVLPLIVDNQQSVGKVKGSWHPNRPAGAFLEYSTQAGRLYFTVMCVLILETPYRHAPLYANE